MLSEDDMKIDFVPNIQEVTTRVIPSIKFHDNDGYKDATIYIDHVAIAYFNSNTGGIIALQFETGDAYLGGGDIKAVEYLQRKGFSLDKKKVGKDKIIYTIKLEKE